MIYEKKTKTRDNVDGNEYVIWTSFDSKNNKRIRNDADYVSWN